MPEAKQAATRSSAALTTKSRAPGRGRSGGDGQKPNGGRMSSQSDQPATTAKIAQEDGQGGVDVAATARRGSRREKQAVAAQAEQLMVRADAPGPAARTAWTFLTNHGHVLIYIARNPDARVRDIAADVGVTERSAHSILRDLARAGYITPEKRGRRNAYRLHVDLAFRHPAEADRSVGELLKIFTVPLNRKRRATARA